MKPGPGRCYRRLSEFQSAGIRGRPDYEAGLNEKYFVVAIKQALR